MTVFFAEVVFEKQLSVMGTLTLRIASVDVSTAGVYTCETVISGASADFLIAVEEQPGNLVQYRVKNTKYLHIRLYFAKKKVPCE